MSAEVHTFQTKVSKLLKLLANSLYSNKEVFLRELVSNASDAIDKLRFAAISKPELTADDPVFAIRIRADKEAGTLTISDNGVGMTLAQANEHLGTIAQSGTEDFLEHLSADEAKNAQQIGQFGVGFYSSFIVADRVTVVSRAAGVAENEAVRWESDGSGTFTSELTTRATRGTDVILHLKDEEKSFLDRWTLRSIISKYSDHISTAVWLWEEKPSKADDEKKEDAKPEFEWVQVNDAKALWTLPPKDVTEEQYKEFYKHLTHDWADPLAWAHNRVEGDLEYVSLLYTPSEAPYDLYNREFQKGLKLFVERVFIMDRAEAFLPNYLRFVKGLVDTNDLPLNVSRELLQESRVTAKLKRALTKRCLSMFTSIADDREHADRYKTFWTQFGRVLKEGIVEDRDNRDAILKLLRFASTKNGATDLTVSLADYVSRMPEGQKNIYYLVASTPEAAEGSPYLEALKKKGVEVLLLWERIDEWMMGGLSDVEFEGHKFMSATAGDLELDDIKTEGQDAEKPAEGNREDDDKAVARFKVALGEKVADVKVSNRLVDSAACVVGAHDQMLTEQMRRMLEAAGQSVPEEKYTLELNLENPLVKKALAEQNPDRFSEWAGVILDQALLSEQGSLKDPAGFLKRLNALLLA